MSENKVNENVEEEDGDKKEGITIYIHETKEVEFNERELENLSNLSKCHIVTGSITFLLQVVSIFVVTTMFMFYEGIFAGLFAITTGLLGTFYIRKKKKSLIVAFLVFSILSSLLNTTFLVLAGIRVADVSYNPRQSDRQIDQALTGCEIILALLQGVTLLTGCTLCCKLFCCNTVAPRRAQYKEKIIQILSFCQVGIGSTFIIMWFINYFVFRHIDREFYTDMDNVYYEIWCGLFFILTGLIGIFTVRQFYKLITPFLILNILGCAFFVVLCICTGVRMGYTGRLISRKENSYDRAVSIFLSEHYNCTQQVIDFKINPISDEEFASLDNETYKCDQDLRQKIRSTEQRIKETNQKLSKYNIFYNVLEMQMVLAVVELIILILTAGFVGHACCCCCGPSQHFDTTAVYVSAKQLETGENEVHVSRQKQLQDQTSDDDMGGQYTRMK